MASLASPLPCRKIETSLLLVQRVSISRNTCSFRSIRIGKKWGYVGICRCLVTTDLAEQGTSMAVGLKPVLKSGSKAELPLDIDFGNSVLWDPPKHAGDSYEEKSKDDEEESNKLIQSLGKVMHKVEKLETSERVHDLVNKPVMNTTTNQRNGKPADYAVGRKSKTFKVVWRKGNPVISIQNVVKGSPKIKNVEKQESRSDGVGKVDPQVYAPLRPHEAPARIHPKLPTRPFVPPWADLKPPIIYDVGLDPKTPTIDGTDSAAKTKDCRPILIDKFSLKKPVADHLIAEPVLPRTKSGKGPVPGKFREEFRKKSSPTGGSWRRMGDDDVEITDEETTELDISIPGLATARKGRKWTKASRKAAKAPGS